MKIVFYACKFNESAPGESEVSLYKSSMKGSILVPVLR